MKITIFYLFFSTLYLFIFSNEINAFNDEWSCYSSDNYRGSVKMIKAGDYNQCSNWNYYSWKSKCCIKLYYYYKNGQKGEKVLCGDVADLRSEMRNWGDLKHGYQGGWKNIYRAVFYCEGANGVAENNHHTGNYEEHLRKGHCVAWRGKNFGQEWEGYMPGKRYYLKDVKYRFWSLHCPDNYEVVWYYKAGSGTSKEYICKGKIGDLKMHFDKWDVMNRNNAWDYVQYFEIRKIGQGSNHANNNNNNNAPDNYKNQEWYNKYRTGGYIVFSQYKYFDGRYAGKVPGDYNYQKLGFWPQSVFVPNYSIYLVMEYKGKDGKTKSAAIKESITDLGKYLYDLGIYKDHEQEPYKAITRLAVIRQ